MAFVRIQIIAFLLFLVIMLPIKGEGNEKTVIQEITSYLPPLDTLVHKALVNSGAFNYYGNQVGLKQEEIKITNKEWSKYIQFNTSAGYGMYDQISVSEQSNSSVNSSLLVTGRQLRYYAGLSVNVPLSYFVQHKNVKKIAKYELGKAVQEQEKVKQQIKTLISEKYYSILDIYQTLVIKKNELETSKIQLVKSEKDFIEGDINISVFSEIRKTHFRIQIEKENAQISFLRAMNELELLTGIELSHALDLWN